MSLRMGIIGIGWAGQRQFQAVRELNGRVTLTAVADSDEVFLRAKAAELGVEAVYTDYRDLLNEPDIDAVSICTPHDLHCEMAVAAAQAGKHILVEKPIAMTIQDATRMIDAAQSNGVRLYVAENLVYTPQSRFLRHVVQAGELVGALTAVSFAWGFRAANFGYPGRRAWLTRPDMGGTGTWMLHGIHTMAQLRYIFGEVAAIYLREHHAASFERSDLEGTVSGVITLENGLHITLIQSCETQMPDNSRGYTLYGDAGCLRAFESGYEVFNGDAFQRLPYPVSALSDYALEIQAFAAHVLDGEAGPTTGLSERRSLAVVLAGYESIRTRHPVDLRAYFGEL
jgi:predicted dehydrogenase